MVDLFQPTIDDEIGCVEREIRMRRQVYPRRVSDRKMKQETADREIAMMEAVLRRLQNIKAPF